MDEDMEMDHGLRKQSFLRIFPFILAFGLLLLLLPACQNSRVTPVNEPAPKERVMFFKAGKVYVSDINDSNARELFTIKYQNAVVGFAKYFAAAETVIYEVSKVGATRPAPELRVYSTAEGHDKLIDTNTQVIAADNKGLVLYTKIFGEGQGKLWLYDIQTGTRSIDTTNAATGVLNKDNSELFHHSFVPPTGPIPEPQALYITDLQSGEQEMVVAAQPHESVSPIKITSGIAAYMKTQGEGGLSDIYSFDRATKTHNLLANGVLSVSNSPKKDGLVIAKAKDGDFNKLQIIEVPLNIATQRILHDFELPDSSSGYHAQLAPASSSIILHGEPSELSLYNYKTGTLRHILDNRNETASDSSGISSARKRMINIILDNRNGAANDPRVSRDQKSFIVIISTIEKGSTGSYEGLYNVDLKTGKRSLIHKKPPSTKRGIITQLQILDMFMDN